MSFAACYREDAPVRVALGALALLFAAVLLTFLAPLFHASNGQSMLDRVFRAIGLVPQTIGTAIVWLMAFIALLVLGLAVLLLRDTGPTVRLDAAGIHDARWSAAPVSWFNIAEFDPVRRLGVEMIAVRLKDASRDAPGNWLGRAARATGLAAPDTVLIALPGLDCTAETLCARILDIGTAAIHAAEEAAEQAEGAAMQNN